MAVSPLWIPEPDMYGCVLPLNYQSTMGTRAGTRTLHFILGVAPGFEPRLPLTSPDVRDWLRGRLTN